MRVLHVCRSFSPLSQTFVYDYVTELKRQGIESPVLTARRVNEEERPHEPVHVVPSPSRWHPERLARRVVAEVQGRVPVSSYWVPHRRRIRSVVESVSPDVVHAHFGPVGAMMAPLAEEEEIPLVVSFYGHDISRLPREKRWRDAYRRVWEYSDAIVGISNHICSQIEEIGAPPKKIKKISLGIRINKFEYNSPSKNYDGGKVQCLHVGRLVEKKSPLKMVKSIYMANKMSDKEIFLKIAGNGPLREDLEILIKKKEMEDMVDILGSISHEEVKNVMREANIYTQHCVTASDGDQEGQGVTFVEASATGLPIVSTNHNGIPDVVIDGKTGILVEEGNVEEMAKEIAKLSEYPEEWEELGKSGRNHVRKNFKVEGQIRKSIELYENII